MNFSDTEQALTFDDILLLPSYSEIHPSLVNISTILTNNMSLNIPILSAAMDTVTESQLAISLARQGGIGIIHKNLSIESQAEQVDYVKRSEAGMITNPITIRPDQKVSDALSLMKSYHISGVPVTDKEGRLVGILTNRDLRFEERTDLTVSELMTKENLKTVSVGTTLDEAKTLLQKYKIEKLLVVDDKYHLKGLITVKDIQKKISYPYACKDDRGRLRVGAAIGIGSEGMARAKALADAQVDILLIDSSHGHSKSVLEMADKIKSSFPEIQLIAGNVATYEGAKALMERGVNAVKVGIGPGSICTTRVVTGCGVPQITAIMECSKASREFNIPIIADGGIKYSGDIVKAIASGAHSVMIGSIFAGTEESPGETILYQGRTFKSYRGMGSIGAMKAGSKDRYFQEQEQRIDKLVPEGIEGMVPYKGTLEMVVTQLIGGLRSGMGLCGAVDISSLQKSARFIKITQAGLKESHPHDVVITKEAPNYMKEN